MKKYLLPLLFTALMLTSCSGIKDPKFKKYSKEVTYEEYNNAISELGEIDSGSDSFVAKAYQGVQIKEATTRGGKTLSSAAETYSIDYQYKYDDENKTGYEKTDTSMVASLSSPAQSSQYAYSSNRECTYQVEAKEGEGDWAVSVDKTSKTVEYKEAFDDGNEISELVQKGEGFTALFLVALYPMQYETASEEEKANWKFYVDGTVFTFTYSKTVEEDVKEMVGEEEVVVYTEANKEELVGQIVVSSDKKSISAAAKAVYKTTDTYKIDYSGHVANEVVDEESKTSYSIDITSKAVKVNKVNISGFYVE